MVSRALSRLRIFLPALLLAVLFANLTPLPADAKVFIKIDDGTEGDPGDGVLDPAITNPKTGTADRETWLPASYLSTSEWLFYAPDVFSLPMALPVQFSGLRFVSFLPRIWSHSNALVVFTDRGWHDAP